DQGAQIDAVDSVGRTGLSAAICGDFGQTFPVLIDVLLKKGANANAVGKNGNAILMDAVSSGSTDAARLLLAAGAAVHRLNPGREGAVMRGAWAANAPMVTLLIDSGADVALESDDRQDAKCIAAERGHPDIVSLITKTAAARDARVAAEK